MDALHENEDLPRCSPGVPYLPKPDAYPPYGWLKDKVGDSGARQQLPIVVGVVTVARNLVSGGILRLAPRENQIAYPALPEKSAMQITRNSLNTTIGPTGWFTGTVYFDIMATASEPSRLAASSVHFTPGARTAWHTHPKGQTIYVTEGVGRCQRRGGPIEIIWPGDRVYFEPGEHHWHGADPPAS